MMTNKSARCQSNTKSPTLRKKSNVASTLYCEDQIGLMSFMRFTNRFSDFMISGKTMKDRSSWFSKFHLNRARVVRMASLAV